MKVIVEFFGFGFAMKQGLMEVDLSGQTVADLVGELSRRMKEFREAVLKQDGTLDEVVQIGLNQEDWVAPGDIGRVALKEGDRVMFMMMAGGG